MKTEQNIQNNSYDYNLTSLSDINKSTKSFLDMIHQETAKTKNQVVFDLVNKKKAKILNRIKANNFPRPALGLKYSFDSFSTNCTENSQMFLNGIKDDDSCKTNLSEITDITSDSDSDINEND